MGTILHSVDSILKTLFMPSCLCVREIRIQSECDLVSHHGQDYVHTVRKGTSTSQSAHHHHCLLTALEDLIDKLEVFIALYLRDSRYFLKPKKQVMMILYGSMLVLLDSPVV